MSVPDQAPASVSQRLLSLDAFRGFVMLFLVAGSLFVDHALRMAVKTWGPAWMSFQLLWTHAHSEGTHAFPWDMIQPAFMFIVGVAVPFSYAKRQALGQSYPRMLGHAVYRAIVLILLGVYLRTHQKQTYWTFEDVVSQIGLGYVFLFLLWNCSRWTQGITALLLLLVYGAAWRFWPQIARVFSVPGVATAGWQASGNPAQAFDVWLRNLLPHEHPFKNHAYYTLNFIPSLANMIFGLMAGELLQSTQSPRRKVQTLCVAGVALSLAGLTLMWTGICPMNKLIWTPTFALYSGGWCVLLLGWFYYVVDVLKWQRWTFPAVVLGANSIAVYIALGVWGGAFSNNLHRHFTWWVTPPWADLTTVIRNFAAMILFWLVFYWMYKRKIFLRI